MKPAYFIRYSIVGDKTWVQFIPAQTIECDPPHVAGTLNSAWVNVRGVNSRNKGAAEKALGMGLLPMPEPLDTTFKRRF